MNNEENTFDLYCKAKIELLNAQEDMRDLYIREGARDVATAMRLVAQAETLLQVAHTDHDRAMKERRRVKEMMDKVLRPAADEVRSSIPAEKESEQPDAAGKPAKKARAS